MILIDSDVSLKAVLCIEDGDLDAFNAICNSHIEANARIAELEAEVRRLKNLNREESLGEESIRYNE